MEGKMRHTKALILGLVIILIPVQTLHAKDLDPFAPLNDEEIICLKEILGHPLIKRKYPDLFKSHWRSPANTRFLVEIENYCTCRAENWQSEYDQVGNSIYFNPESRFKREDMCAAANLNKKHMLLVYDVIVSSRFNKHLRSKINQRYPTPMRMVASEISYDQKVSCLEMEIVQKCTRVKSLNHTYSCIQMYTTGHKEFSSIEKTCPSLSVDEVIQDSWSQKMI